MMKRTGSIRKFLLAIFGIVFLLTLEIEAGARECVYADNVTTTTTNIEYAQVTEIDINGIGRLDYTYNNISASSPEVSKLIKVTSDGSNYVITVIGILNYFPQSNNMALIPKLDSNTKVTMDGKTVTGTNRSSTGDLTGKIGNINVTAQNCSITEITVSFSEETDGDSGSNSNQSNSGSTSDSSSDDSDNSNGTSDSSSGDSDNSSGTSDNAGSTSDSSNDASDSSSNSSSSSSSSSSKKKSSSDSKPASWILNPDEMYLGSASGFGATAKLGKQEQGALGKAAFAAARPIGWTEAFTFNMTINDKADYTQKTGRLVLTVPSQYIKAGRTFAVLALDQNGTVLTYPDLDQSDATVTVDLNHQGYAFALIYTN